MAPAVLRTYYQGLQNLPVRVDASPVLVFSLDFELHWGVRDKHSAQGAYTPRLLGARAAVPRILDLFTEFDAASTWAVVGFLFASSREERQHFDPSVLASYTDPTLSPYDERTGDDEASDLLHFAPSLIAQIAATPRQEVATHTYSHYYCTEPGQTREMFAGDIDSALAIARTRGLSTRSIVFPRNQHNPAYDDILLARGITAYRGNPRSWMWRFTGAGESASAARRSARMLDAYLPLHPFAELQRWEEVLQPSGLCDVRATAFLRPWSPARRALEPLRVNRLCGAVRRAARMGRLFHLWWHPHNFGTNTAENLAVLREILETFAECRERYGMLSLTMAEVDRHVRVRAAAPASRAASVAAVPATVGIASR